MPRTPHLNTEMEMFDSSETVMINFYNSDSAASLKKLLATNDTLVVLHTPHLSTRREMLGRSETLSIKS